MFRIVFLAAIALCSLPAQASSWKLLETRADTQLNFYDADTVEKHGNAVTIWRKLVYDEASNVVEDGIYSRAMKMVFDCKKKTFQILEASHYDKNHKFLDANKIPGAETTPGAGTVVAGILDEVCASNFPTAKPPVKNNDVYGYARYVFEGAHKDSAPE